MPCMTQTSTNPLRTPHAPPYPHPQASKTPSQRLEAHLSPKKPPGTAQPGRARPGPTIRRRRRAGPQQPVKPTPPGPQAPPPTLATIRDPDLLRATLQGRAPTTPLGWYRLQEDWTKLTVKARRNLTTPGNGLHETILDLVLWRARKHTQGQHVWIPPIEWGQALTHDTDINVTRRGTVRLRRAPAEKDHPADPNRPSSGNRPPHQPATPPSAPPASAPQTPTPPPHLQTVTTRRRRSGLQSSSAGTTT